MINVFDNGDNVSLTQKSCRSYDLCSHRLCNYKIQVLPEPGMCPYNTLMYVDQSPLENHLLNIKNRMIEILNMTDILLPLRTVIVSKLSISTSLCTWQS